MQLPADGSRAGQAPVTWVLPLALGAAGVAEAALSPSIAEGSGLPAVFAAAMALALVRRVDSPMTALVGCLGVFTVQEVWGAGTLSEAVTPFVMLVVAMYSAALRLNGVSLLVAAAGSVAAICGTIVIDAAGPDVDSLVYALIVIAAAFAAGRLLGQRTREASRLAEEKRELVSDREERERRAVARERARIAHELHDLITHRVSAMVLQASTERRIVDRSQLTLPPQIATLTETLHSIELLGREAMSELRQLLGALAHEDDQPRAPQPGTRDIPALVAETAAAGVRAALEVTGRPRALPPPLEVSLYRVVQEALSNAMRHAPGSDVTVRIEYRSGSVEVEVTNTAGSRAGPESTGLGLGVPGMRERARQLGGSLSAASTPGGGFQVRARFPAPDEDCAEALT